MSTPHPGTREQAVFAFEQGTLAPASALVVREVPVLVRLNGREIITLLASDEALDFLAVGFLRAEGFLARREDLRGVRVDPGGEIVDVEAAGVDPLAGRLLERPTVTSGCGKGATFYHALDALQVRPVAGGPTVTPAQVLHLMGLLLRGSALYRVAGGVHTAALAAGGDLVLLRDDIGRHNAVDKLHGECFLGGIPLGDKVLLTTGRVSSEILIKTAKMGVPVLIARSVPTSLALDLAERTGQTIIGRVRGGAFRVFCGSHRVRP